VFKFFKKFLKNNMLFKEGDLVKIKNPISFNDKQYFIVLSSILPNEDLLKTDKINDMGMCGIVWGIDDSREKNEVYLRLWNPNLKNNCIIVQSYVEKI